MTQLERIHLEIIRAVHQEGTMTAAADAIHLTQSALSHSMRKLEDQLGVKLWLREGRQLKPTQAGSYLLKVSNRLLPQLTHTERKVEAICSRPTRFLTNWDGVSSLLPVASKNNGSIP